MRVSDFMRGVGNVAARTAEERLPQVEAEIKKRISASEAVVEIEGREVRAAFEKGVPPQSRVTVQIIGETETAIEVRTVSGGRTAEAPRESAEAAAEKLLRDAGAKATPEMKEAVRVLASGKLPVTRETIATVQQVMSKGEGTVQQKLNVLAVMSQKNIDVTPKSFEAVFRTMYGPTLGTLMEELASELPELASSAKQASVEEGRTAAAVHIAENRPSGAERLVRQLRSVASAMEEAMHTGRSLNKDELQKAVKVIERELDQLGRQPGAISKETAQKVKQLAEGIERAIQETPTADRKVTAERVLKHVSARDIEQVAKQAAREVRAYQEGKIEAPIVQPQVNSAAKAEPAVVESPRSMPQQAAGNRLARQLETIAQVIENRKPVDKEALQALVRQIKSNSELQKLPADMQRNVGDVVRSVEEAIRRTPASERTIRPEHLAQYVPARQVTEAARQAAEQAAVLKERPPAQPEAGRTITMSSASLSSFHTETGRLAQQLGVLAEAMESRQPLNKEAIQRLMQQIKANPDLTKAEPVIQQRVQRIVQGVEAAVRQTPAREQSISSERLAAHVSIDEVKQLARQAAVPARISGNRQPAVPSAASGQSTAIPSSEKHEPAVRAEVQPQITGVRAAVPQAEQSNRVESTLTKQLDILVQAISRQQPLNKDVLQKLAQQIQKNPQLSGLSRDVQQQVRAMIEKVEQAVKETPRVEPAVSPEKLARQVPIREVQEVSRRAAEEITRSAAARQSETPRAPAYVQSSPAQREVPLSPPVQQSGELSRQLELLSRIVGERRPIEREILRQLAQQIKGNPEISRLEPEVRRQVEDTVRRMEQGVRETSSQERNIPTERLTRQIPVRETLDLIQRVEQQTRTADGVAVQQHAAAEKTSETGRIVRQLEVLSQAVSRQQPLNREALRQLVEQIKQSPELPSVSREVQQQVRQAAERIERAIAETPAVEPAVSPERIARHISARDIAVAAERVAKEVQSLPAERLARQVSEANSQRTVSPTPKAEEAPQQVKEVEARAAEMPVPSERGRLAEMVLDMRSAGKVTRPQIEALRQTVEQVVTEAGGSKKLRQSTNEFMEHLGRDLRMSMSYEAVGRSAEGKAMVQRAMDQLVQLFKLPAAEAARTSSAPMGETMPEAAPLRMLETMSQMYDRLSGIVAAARAEMKGAQGITASQLLGGISETPDVGDLLQARRPQQIIQDVAETLLTAAETEGLPSEMTQKLQGMLQQINQAAAWEVDGIMPDNVQQIPIAEMDIDTQMQQLQQVLEEEAGRMAAYANVQTANFERVSHYIPDHLHETAAQFKQVKKEITNNVDRMTQFLEQNVPQASSYIKRIIEPTIEMVDRLVAKGEFALFADMEFEHDVLKLSSQLQSIKGMLDKGQQSEALAAFRDVRQQLDKLNWQPSYMKVERFFSKNTGEGAMQNPLDLYTRDWRGEQLTGRGVQEWMRGMGMNHEREAIDWMVQRTAENRDLSTGMNNVSGHQSQSFSRSTGADTGRLFSEGDQQSSPQGQPHSMKSFIMEQLENGTTSPRVKEMMEQVLSNVTGQQLLSKQDPGAPMQSMYVQLPLPWEEGMKTVNVQINSRNNGEQMDWENCSLFFFLDTPKYGDTGIGVTVVEREMTIRVQNNHPNAEQVFAPYIPQLKHELQGLGYRVQAVSFGAFAPAEETQKNPAGPAVDVKAARADVAKQLTSREGVDFSI